MLTILMNTMTEKMMGVAPAKGNMPCRHHRYGSGSRRGHHDVWRGGVGLDGSWVELGQWMGESRRP